MDGQVVPKRRVPDVKVQSLPVKKSYADPATKTKLSPNPEANPNLNPCVLYGSKINKAYSVLGIIKRNFIHMDESSFILLYKSIVRPHLEYANSMWCPYKQRDIKELEKIQKELLNW